MNLPKTVKELKKRNWTLTIQKMKSMRPGVSYSAYTSPDNKYVANVDNSDGEVTMIFTRGPISVIWVHPTTQRGYDYLMGKKF